MNKNKVHALIFFVGTMIGAAAQADDLTGEGEFGFTSASGNAESKSLNAKIGLGKKHGDWTHNIKLELLQSSDSGVDSGIVLCLQKKVNISLLKKPSCLDV